MPETLPGGYAARWLLSLTVLAAACGDVTVDPTHIICDSAEGHGCPDDYHCAKGFCAPDETIQGGDPGDFKGDPDSVNDDPGMSNDDEPGDDPYSGADKDAICGDGVLDWGEACDDSNYNRFDGCDTSCLVEDGWTCPGGADCRRIGWWKESGVPSTSTLNDVWGIMQSTITRAWAVGDGGTIVYFNGADWQTQDSPVTTDLNGIWGFSLADIWAVGDNNVILHYDGSDWTKVTSPLGSSAILYTVWGWVAGDVWAMGLDGATARANSGNWSEVYNSSGCPCYGLWGRSAAEVYAVGYNGMIITWSGSAWTQPFGDGGSSFRDIAGGCSTGADLFAVRENGSIWKIQGTVWSQQSGVPTTGDSSHGLNGIFGTSDGCSGFRAVGKGGTVLAYSGTAWESESVQGTDNLRAIWGHTQGGGLAFAVGEAGAVYRYFGE